MKTEQTTSGFDAETVSGIVNHMNEDHADALHLYIKAYTTLNEDSIQDLRMTDIDTDGICLAYKIGSESGQVRITFAQTIGKSLKHASAVRGALVAMVKRARS